MWYYVEILHRQLFIHTLIYDIKRLTLEENSPAGFVACCKVFTQDDEEVKEHSTSHYVGLVYKSGKTHQFSQIWLQCVLCWQKLRQIFTIMHDNSSKIVQKSLLFLTCC